MRQLCLLAHFNDLLDVFFPCVWLLVWFRRAQPPVHSGWTTTNPALYGGAHVDVSIFAPKCFLVSNKPRLFSWFPQNFACFPVFFKILPDKRCCHQMVFTRSFRLPFPLDRCDPLLFHHSTNAPPSVVTWMVDK